MQRFKRIYIEISNICNLQCDFCPEVERGKKVMTPETFRQVMTQAAPLTDEVSLHLMGEPLGHPDLGPIVDICAEFNVPVNITSNGVLLLGVKRDILFRPIVRQVNFSVHSFEANFGAKDVEPYLKRLFSFTREALTTRPDLYINYRLWDLHDASTLTEKNVAIRDLLEQEYDFKFADLKVDIRRKKGYKITGRLYVSFDSRFAWPSLKADDRGDKGFCHGLTHHIGIHADGTVVPCCLDKEADIPLGNILSGSLVDIVDSPRAEAMRAGFAAGRLVEDLCKRCGFIERFSR